MGSSRTDQHHQLQLLARQKSWFSLTLHEVESQLGDVGKPLRRMNLDELLQNVWTAEAKELNILDTDNSSAASSLQRQASFSLAKAFSGKTVDEVWRDSQLGQKRKNAEEMKVHGGQATLGEITLEDFLVKAGLFAEVSSVPINGASPSIDTLSDIGTSRRKREAADAIEKILDRRLRRKIKNRESAARSRARKQAYHNELVIKVSRLEEENVKLKKEKGLEMILPWELSPEARYQLRRTSSF